MVLNILLGVLEWWYCWWLSQKHQLKFLSFYRGLTPVTHLFAAIYNSIYKGLTVRSDIEVNGNTNKFYMKNYLDIMKV